MTIIAAIHEPGVGTWIGSDRLRSGAYRLVMTKPKWCICARGWAIAVSGYARASDIIENVVDTANARTVFHAAAQIRDALEADGFERNKDEGLTKNFGCGFIIAYHGGVWDCDGGFATSPVPPGQLHAKGSAADYALGAFHALRQSGEADAHRILAIAIDAACRYDAGCGGEPYIHLLKAE